MAKPNIGPQQRWLSFQRSAVNIEERTVELSFSSEIRVERWYGAEILNHDPESVDLERLNQIGVLLFNHNGNVVLGKVERAWLDVKERRGKAIVRFDEDADSEKIFQKVINETLRGVSIWYNVDNWEEVAAGAKSLNGRFEGPCYIAMKWEPYEVSIVSVPADPTVGVGRSSDHPENDRLISMIESMGRQLADLQSKIVPITDPGTVRQIEDGQLPDLSEYYRRLAVR